MRYYVLRVYDSAGDECHICKEREKEANAVGGLEFDEDVVNRGMARGFYTGLFHDGCRCRLVPAMDGTPIEDELDRELLLFGHLFHVMSEDMNVDEKMEIQGKYGTT